MQTPELRYCPECDALTTQKLVLYDPDDPNGMWIWQCTDCGEPVDIKKDPGSENP
jgi:hypothetical protein